MEGAFIALDNFDSEKGGVVVSTASMAGLLPIGAPAVYSMTKGLHTRPTPVALHSELCRAYRGAD
jgi:short-subunit dehydrogenase